MQYTVPRTLRGLGESLPGNFESIQIGLPRPRLSAPSLMVLASSFIVLAHNRAFWRYLLDGLPEDAGAANLMLVAGFTTALFALVLLPMLLLSSRWTVKPGIAILILASAVCSYFMDSFGTVIDRAMIQNSLQTDVRETSELLGPAFFWHLLWSGFLPAWWVMRVQLTSAGIVRESLLRLTLLVAPIVLVAGFLTADYKSFTLWGREHKAIKSLVNPTAPLVAAVREATDEWKGSRHRPVLPIGLDATRSMAQSGKPRVVVMLVGETARRANFQLAGYPRATNPRLSRIPELVTFTDVVSCGTATAISVPCMFSRDNRAGFDRHDARYVENALDVIQRTGVSVVWRDNNSDCKGVCLRVPSEDLRHATHPDFCHDGECRDEILLEGIDQQIASAKDDTLIVLHLLGSHGPSYYRRYPDRFRVFRPDCDADAVQTCSRESIVNAYDNTIVYTDHVIAEAIAALEAHRDIIEPTLIYVSDHGESLGENGIYLHGLPYGLAPREQKEVPLMVWAPGAERECIAQQSSRPHSHDDVFDTLLGLFKIQSEVYRADGDLLRDCETA